MKLNWKERLKNKTFVVTMATMIIAFVYQLLGLFDIVPAISQDGVMSVILIIVNILAALGILVDPTTSGLSDSARALTYGTESDVRRIDDNEEGKINE